MITQVRKQETSSKAAAASPTHFIQRIGFAFTVKDTQDNYCWGRRAVFVP
jgi:hypothetical protein